jgi:hypothetical protein
LLPALGAMRVSLLELRENVAERLRAFGGLRFRAL